ncbi:AraC family transcriptional regulator, L-rhamnose operon transcriptional activator RhaR [Verrucomicrobium sp. GAS474]|uniref:helix-turn-helix domain-containing protein n=1 Tax=Verrucomicrobium sp. GAS474 TaxID=1882831 RepID=UPI00087B5C4D|nr:helix-turn-helix domain-containing protein [Verrucomicrobium sp. GAS474]SDT86022.1 AraC family transcriptional regulator, L-rhamnose operon transcriptional activator RhaR [Verrucomicrobium sp. GAS474]
MLTRVTKKGYQPLLLESLHLQAGPIRVHRLRLNRHIEETSVVALHEHPYSQLLIYVTGQGEQRCVDRPPTAVHSGTAALFPPHAAHSFAPGGARRPLCLVVDFDFRGAGKFAPWIGLLPQSERAEIGRSLSALVRLKDADRAAIRLREAALVLSILEKVLPAGGWMPRFQPEGGEGALVRRTRQLLASRTGPRISNPELARRLGYQQDYLNRLLQRAAGTTLGQLRDARRLEEAKKALAKGSPVRKAAAETGWADANYFTRWFRKQTGLPPSQWRKSKLDSPQSFNLEPYS